MYFFILPRENDNQVYSENKKNKNKLYRKSILLIINNEKGCRVLNRGLECKKVDPMWQFLCEWHGSETLVPKKRKSAWLFNESHLNNHNNLCKCCLSSFFLFREYVIMVTDVVTRDHVKVRFSGGYWRKERRYMGGSGVLCKVGSWEITILFKRKEDILWE